MVQNGTSLQDKINELEPLLRAENEARPIDPLSSEGEN